MTGEYGEIDACPYCNAGGSKVRRRVANSEDHHVSADPGKDWYCEGCGRGFDVPRRRERTRPTTTPSGSLAATLEDASPDAVGGGDA